MSAVAHQPVAGTRRAPLGWIVRRQLLIGALGLLGGVGFGALVRWEDDVFGHGLATTLVGVPAVLAAGWATLALWRRGHRRWRLGGFVAAALALLPAVALLVLPPMTGISDRLPESGAASLLVPVAVYDLAGLLAGVVFARCFGALGRYGVAVGGVACGVAALLTIGSFHFYLVVGPVVVAPLVVLPFVAANQTRYEGGPPAADERLQVGYLLLFAAVAVGVVASVVVGG